MIEKDWVICSYAGYNEYSKKYTVKNIKSDMLKNAGRYVNPAFMLYTKAKNWMIYYPKWIRSLYPFDIHSEEYQCEKVEYSFNWELREDQQRVLKELENRTEWLIIAWTWWGKTYAIAWLINQKKVKTLVVVPKKSIAEWEWWMIKTFQNIFWSERVSQFTWDKQEMNDITVVLWPTFNKYRKELAHHFWMLIIDEAHLNFISVWKKKKGSEFTNRLDVYNLFPCKYFFGLTATPESDFVKPETFELVFWDKVQGGAVKMLPQIKYIKYKTWITWFLDWADCIEQIYWDEERLEQQCIAIQETMKDRKMWVVFLDRIELVDKITENLNNRWVFARWFSSKTKDREIILKEVEDNKWVIVATYQTLWVGFNYPTIDTGFYYCPVKFKWTVKQMVGRILRTQEWKLEPILIDWVDDIIWFQWNQRKKAYKEEYGIEPIKY